MVDIKSLLLGLAPAVTAAIFAGCWSQQEVVPKLENDTGASSDSDTDTDTDTDTDSDTDIDTDMDTGPIECNMGEYNGDITIITQSDVATLAGYTEITGDLEIKCHSCTDLDKLVCLTSVGGSLDI